MKYFPLIWAALWRKPVRTVLTFLAAVSAFTLFGVAIGFNATYVQIVADASADRVLVNPRFDGHLTLAQRDQIARMDGVRAVGVYAYILGYYREPKNRVIPIFVDRAIRGEPQMALSPAQWDQLEADPAGVFLDDHTAARLGLKAGDALPVLTSAPSRRDGGKLWTFQVLGIFENPPSARGGLVVANYDYFDKERPLEQSGWVDQFDVLIADPDRAAAFTEQVDRTFASSANPTWSISEKVLQQTATSYQYNIPLVTEEVWPGAGLFMILFLIGNGIGQSVLRERIPEFAVLKTLGFSDAVVMALVFAEAAIPCLLGALAGFVIALGVASKIARLPVMQKILSSPPPSLSLSVVALGFVCAALVAFSGAALPAWRMRRLDIATALRR